MFAAALALLAAAAADLPDDAGAASAGRILLPPGFAPAPDLTAALLDTAAAAPSSAGVARRLLAVFVERADAGDAGGAPVLAVTEVGEPLPAEPGLREAAFALVAAHLREQLGLDARIDRPVATATHVGVTAHVGGGPPARTVRLAFFPAGDRHVVIWASHPAGRATDLGPAIDALLAAYEPPGGEEPTRPTRRGLVRALAIGAAAVLVLVVAKAWRRRRREDAP